MEKCFEINYTIEDIQGMSREEQLEYLEYLYDLRTEIMRQIDDKKSFYSEISYLIGEIEEKTTQDIMKEIQRALSSIQLNIRISLYNDGSLATHIGDVSISIQLYSDKITVNYTAQKYKMSYRELMFKLLAGAKPNGYDSYAYHLNDKSHKEVIIDILTTLSNNKDKFEEIANR